MTILGKVKQRIDENKIIISDGLGEVTCTCNKEELFFFADVRIKLITRTSLPRGTLYLEVVEIKDSLL